MKSARSSHEIYIFGSQISRSFIEEIKERKNVAPADAKVYGQYFSHLKSAEDFVCLVDSLLALQRFMSELYRTYAVQLEQAEELYTRYYCYGERSYGLDQALRKHFLQVEAVELNKKEPNDQRLANLETKLAHKLICGPGAHPASRSLYNLVHTSGSFAFSFELPVGYDLMMRENPQLLLGLENQPQDFIHLPSIDKFEALVLTESQIAYVVDKTIEFAEALLDQATADIDVVYFNRARRSSDSVKARMREVRLRDDSIDKTQGLAVGAQILMMSDNLKQTSLNYLNYALGWILAINYSFK